MILNIAKRERDQLLTWDFFSMICEIKIFDNVLIFLEKNKCSQLQFVRKGLN